jgi:short-subunit dehydrogenase
MEPRKIIIIGASSGIGRELAKRYASQGNHVAVTGRRAALLEELAGQHPGRILARTYDVCDMNNEDELERLVRELGGLDLLLICAGTGAISKSLDRAIDTLTVDTNVNAFAQIACWGFNHFVEKGKGQMANISSLAAHRGNSAAPAYSASKGFQSLYFEGLHMKAMRMKIPIRITDVQPGFVRTKMAKGDHQFWVVPLEKAGRQIQAGIDAGRTRFQVSHRWSLIAKLMDLMPGFIYHRFG